MDATQELTLTEIDGIIEELQILRLKMKAAMLMNIILFTACITLPLYFPGMIVNLACILVGAFNIMGFGRVLYMHFGSSLQTLTQLEDQRILYLTVNRTHLNIEKLKEELIKKGANFDVQQRP